MKKDIHPTYFPDAKVTCATCGNTWTTDGVYFNRDDSSARALLQPVS